MRRSPGVGWMPAGSTSRCSSRRRSGCSRRTRVLNVQILYTRAYNKWLTEIVLPREPRLRTMLCLPFSDPDESYRMAKEYIGKKGVSGFLVPAVFNVPVHDNRFMKLYALLEEAGMPIAFHGPRTGATARSPR